MIPDFLAPLRKMEYFTGYPCDKEDCALYKSWEEPGSIQELKPRSNPTIVMLCLACRNFKTYDHYKVEPKLEETKEADKEDEDKK